MKYNFSREDASFLSDVLSEIDDRQDEKFQLSKELFLTQKDKTDIIRIESLKSELSGTMYKLIYTAGVIQFIAIIGSIIAILSFMHKQFL